MSETEGDTDFGWQMNQVGIFYLHFMAMQHNLEIMALYHWWCAAISAVLQEVDMWEWWDSAEERGFHIWVGRYHLHLKGVHGIGIV